MSLFFLSERRIGMTAYLHEFIFLGILGLITTVVLGIIYWLAGKIKEKSVYEERKTKPYTGGKELTGRKTVFKTLFFQYAIYFLIFDVVAFITAIVSFTQNWNLFVNGQINRVAVHVLGYLSIILFLFIILPKQEEEVV